RGFPTDPSSNLPTEIELPLELATRDSYTSYDRGSGQHTVPDAKYLGVAADASDLAKLAGTSGGLGYYVRLTFDDGSTYFVNKDGKAGQNFDVDASELAPQPQS